MYPIVRKHFIPNGVRLFQPIFANSAFKNHFHIHYENPYVKSHCLDWSSGIGNIFHEHDGTISVYPNIANDNWRPNYVYSSPTILPEILDSVLGFQLYTYTGMGISMERLSADKKKRMQEISSGMKKFRKRYVEIYKRSIEEILEGLIERIRKLGGMTGRH